MDQLSDQPMDGQKPKISKQLAISTIVIVLLIIAGAALLNGRYKDQKAKNDAKNNQAVEDTNPKFPTEHAKQGSLIAGFPVEFSANSTAIQDSYKVTYDANTVMYDAVFSLDKTEAEAFDYYSKYLTSHGYVIRESNSSKKVGTEFIATLYAEDTKGNKANIVISEPKAYGSTPVKVNIAYIAGKK